jgi:hypothetical protein
VKTLRTSKSARLLLIPLATLLSCSAAQAQSFSNAHESSSLEPAAYSVSSPESPAAFGGGGQAVASPLVHHGIRPLSRLAIGPQISPLGVGAEAAVNISQHFDGRVTGSLFSYSTSFTTSGFNIDANLHLASAGASLDYYPFHNGFRLSPGILVYNQNRANANAPVTPGTSFELNDQTFYAATPNPSLGITALSGKGSLNLHPTRPAFTATTGWGSLIPRSGRRWAIPFEIGVAFTGSPDLKMNLSGWACYDQAQTLCTNVNDPANPISVQIQNDLQAQLAKWKSDLDTLKFYPIISTGIVFNFNIL